MGEEGVGEPPIIDTHTHLFLDAFSGDLPEVLDRARAVGVRYFLMPNIDLSTLDALLAVSERYADWGCLPMVGLHPLSVPDSEGRLREVLSALEVQVDRFSERWLAIGEVGMDLYRVDREVLPLQREALDVQCQWAIRYDLPVSVHTRGAFREAMDVLERWARQGLRGVLHCFTGGREEARRACDAGFYLGIGGIVTFRNAGVLREAVRYVGLDRLVLETDAPFLAPVPHRGKRNEPAHLKYVIRHLADLMGCSMWEVRVRTTRNALAVFTRLQQSIDVGMLPEDWSVLAGQLGTEERDKSNE